MRQIPFMPDNRTAEYPATLKTSVTCYPAFYSVRKNCVLKNKQHILDFFERRVQLLYDIGMVSIWSLLMSIHPVKYPASHNGYTV